MIKRAALGLAAAAGLAALLIISHPSMIPSSVAGLLKRAAGEGEELIVTRKPMRFWVDSTGVLRATSVQNFGAPPEFGNYWQFQIVSMVPEGKNVKKGDLLVMFDAQKIQDDLQRYQSELDQAAKELERTRVQIDLEGQELTARVAEAENKYEKLKLKQEGIGTDIVSARQVEMDGLALEQTKREVEALRDRIQWHKKTSEATYKIIASKKSRAENKVNEIKKGIEGFQVKSDRDGIAVYKLKWNGERFQVGETCWSGLSLIEIPDLNTILVEAFVPEVDIGKLKLGQRADVTIDAFPGKTYTGKVAKIGTLVRSKAWDIPNRILDVQITLDNLETSIMRPAMSVKAKIETGLINEVIAVPLKAVRTTADGSMVQVKTDSGWAERKVKLGESNSVDVAIIEGLSPGEKIAVDYSRARQKAST
ncbi:MAG TPA: efflux RND transporter periplasmic adaptor subunit [Acidobacteriota bacterium]|nr:efflux RND transporter periplasmic adaptor subunit [Acidobacteriota bacterium]